MIILFGGAEPLVNFGMGNYEELSENYFEFGPVVQEMLYLYIFLT